MIALKESNSGRTASLFANAVVVGALLLTAATASAEEPWIIDTHTHFKGPEQIELENRTTNRHPQNTLGHVVRPEDYQKVADRLNIESTVVVEAVDQDQPQFNDWVLEQAKSQRVCGYVARGDLSSRRFLDHYRHYRESGYLKGYRFRRDELHGYLEDATAREHLKRLEQDGMVVDLLVNPRHADDVVRLAQEFPDLTIVLNHCFGARMKGGEIGDAWKRAVEQCAEYPNVHCKLSSILNFADTPAFAEPAPTDLEHYLPVLESCFEAFGEDRVIFATNWGVCTHFGKVDDVVRLATEFFESKGESALRKGMRENAIRVYSISRNDLR